MQQELFEKVLPKFMCLLDVGYLKIFSFIILISFMAFSVSYPISSIILIQFLLGRYFFSYAAYFRELGFTRVVQFSCRLSIMFVLDYYLSNVLISFRSPFGLSRTLSH